MVSLPGIYEFLAAWIASQTDIVALIADRYGPIDEMQTDVYPQVTYTVISHPSGFTMAGPDGLATPRVQIDVWDKNPDSCKNIAFLIHGNQDNPRLDGYSGVLGGVTVQNVMRMDMRDLHENPVHGESTGIYRRSMDFEIAYNE